MIQNMGANSTLFEELYREWLEAAKKPFQRRDTLDLYLRLLAVFRA